MHEIWKASAYRPDAVHGRYARAMIDGGYRLYEVGSHGLTIRECEADRAELTAEVAAACDEQRGQAFGCVRLTETAEHAA